MPSPDQLRALQTQIAPAAIASEKLTGIPAELSCAQCGLESAWLASMPANSRNPFGIKGTARDGVLTQTHEWFTALELWSFLLRGEGRAATLDPKMQSAAQNGRRRFIVQDYFQRFDSLAAAFTRHGSLLLNGAAYGYAVKQYQVDHDMPALLRALAPYATDPHYVEQLEEIVLSKEVTEICAQLRLATTGYQERSPQGVE